MDFDGIENLNENQIIDLYNDVIERGEEIDEGGSTFTVMTYRCRNGHLWECAGSSCYDTGDPCK